MDILLIIFKWTFVFVSVFLALYLYRQENSKLSLIKKHVKDTELLSELAKYAKNRMIALFAILAVFSVWMIAYDFKVEDVTKTNTELTNKLQNSTGNFENLGSNVNRLITPNQGISAEIQQDIINFYSEIVLHHFVLKKCKLAPEDDIFIINSAMLREMILNKVPVSNRDLVIKNAKTEFNKNYVNFECSEIHGKFNAIINSYQNYIIATREVLRSTLN